MDTVKIRQGLKDMQTQIIKELYHMEEERDRIDWTRINNDIAKVVHQIEFLESEKRGEGQW